MEKTLAEQYKEYKDGKTDKAPVVHKQVSVKVNSGGKEVILSMEELDRDGETVMMDGMRLPEWSKENGIPLIDSHNSHASVVVNGLGALRNPRIEVRNGKKSLVCDPEFAPTPNGQAAEILYMGYGGGKPYFTNVSMGFLVYDYDNATRTIKEWEPFEGSLVTIGANYSARFVDKSLKADTNMEQDLEQMAKHLARFKQIQEPFKEFTKLFLSEEFCKMLGYEKDGDLSLDINNIHDIIVTKFSADEEAPETVQEAPEEEQIVEPPVEEPIEEQLEPQEETQLEVSQEAMEAAIVDAFTQKLEQELS